MLNIEAVGQNGQKSRISDHIYASTDLTFGAYSEYTYNALMQETILRTKHFVPRARPNLVHRPRLIDQLNHGSQLGRKLTLVSASAVFGKNTLISDWFGQSKQPVGWFSLDDEDSDPTRFLAYLIAALQTIEPAMG